MMTFRERMTASEAAKYLQSLASPGTEATLEVWRCLGRGPKFYRIGRNIVYHKVDLDAFAAGTPVETIDSRASGR